MKLVGIRIGRENMPARPLAKDRVLTICLRLLNGDVSSRAKIFNVLTSGQMGKRGQCPRLPIVEERVTN